MSTSAAGYPDAAVSPAPLTGVRPSAPTRTGVPLNYFGMSFGLAGLAGTWTEAATLLGSPPLLGELLWALAMLVWIGTIGTYAVGARTLSHVVQDLRHPVLGPFAALVPLPPMLLGAHLAGLAPVVSDVLVWVAVGGSALFGGWFLARIVTAPPGFSAVHGGYLLPTVAAGLVAAQTLATIGAHDVALAAFGSGALFWALFGAALLARVLSGPELPGGLLPTFAIFAAPPAVAGNAWWVLSGQDVGYVGLALAGAMVAVVLPHLFLLPRYLAQPFTPGFWAFTFTAAASATFGVRMLSNASTVWSTAGAWLLVAAATVVIGVIGVLTVVALAPRRKEE
ncbi:transporter [Promicromonospora sp. NPDC060271]|uniref:SLAC1 family transporter n=1 Tax=Promicromonospora sp. NPDC060271 TaxID=3347089 RepID=UPI0036678FA4